MNDRARFISVKHASIFSGLDKQTIRKLVDNKTITGYKTPSGQRRISQNSLQEMCGTVVSNEELQNVERENFLYCRVSTRKQLDDLSRQVEFITQPQYVGYTVIKDIGSGINFKRKGLSKILDACIRQTIGTIVVAHKDRLSRFAFDLIEQIVIKGGGCIKVLDNTDNQKSREQELSEDLLSIIHIFNCKQMGARSYKAKNSKNKVETNATTEASY
jgi:predicted site-specific integrase-resolvase